MRTESSAAMNNIEELLARKRWRMDNVGSDSVYHRWRSIPLLNTGGQNVFNHTSVFIVGKQGSARLLCHLLCPVPWKNIKQVGYLVLTTLDTGKWLWWLGRVITVRFITVRHNVHL